jgi:DNA-binding MurR/RpiR family transcriptional regulator
VYDSLKRAERRAADCLLAAPEEIASMGVVQFARRAGCSEATTVRLAQRLGYAGFPELRAEFSHPATEPSATAYRDIRTGDSPETVVRKVFENSVQALRDTLASLDRAHYGAAVEALLAAGRIAFFGLGNAAVVAREAYHKFLRIGVPVFAAEDPDLQLIILRTQMRRGDLLVAISYSGESKPTLTAARLARAQGLRVLAVTNFPRSSLAAVADMVLLTAVFQAHVNGEIGSKRLAQLAVLESLYVNYLLRRGDQARQSLAAANAVLSQNKHHEPTRPVASSQRS